MHSIKSHYSLAEAAELARCSPNDLLHYGARRKIRLIVGVPDWCDVGVYDETTNSAINPFLMTPQLLVLSPSYCLKIELNGRTEQCDFPEGYLIGSSGDLNKILPNYGHPELNHEWVYWRTYRDRLVNLLELVSDRLFVLGSDLDQFKEPKTKPANNEAVSAKKSPTKRSLREMKDLPPSSQYNIDADKVDGDLHKEPEQEETKSDIATNMRPNNDKLDTPTEPQPRNISILRLKQVLIRTGLSRSTIYDKMDKGSPRFDSTFPKQVSLGIGSVGWYEAEVVGWIESRKGITPR